MAISTVIILAGCSKNEPKEEELTSSVLLLKVDYKSYEFEGGKEFSFAKNSSLDEALPLTVTYETPCDFGYLQVAYKPNGTVIFDGTILRSGMGKINTPKDFSTANGYSRATEPIANVNDTDFEAIFVDITVPLDIYKRIWSSVSNLTVAADYYAKNPRIGIFLYTPSVGMPADPENPEGSYIGWKWFVVLYK